MDKRKTRNIFATISGAMTGVVIIALGEWVLQQIYPLPPGVDMNDRKAIASAIAAMPISAFTLLLLNYAIASIAGGLVASLVSGRKSARPAIAAGVILTIAGLMNIIMISHPVWFSVVNLMEYLPFAWIGSLMVQKNV